MDTVRHLDATIMPSAICSVIISNGKVKSEVGQVLKMKAAWALAFISSCQDRASFGIYSRLSPSSYQST